MDRLFNLRLILVFIISFFLAVSCSSSLFKSGSAASSGSGDGDGSQMSDDDDDDDDDDNEEDLSDEEFDALEFKPISSTRLRAEHDADDPTMKGATIVLRLVKIKNKKLSASASKKTTTTFTYQGRNTDHSTTYGQKGLCPDNKQKLTFEVVATRKTEDVTQNPDIMVAAKVDSGREIWMGMADNGNQDCHPMRFHSIDSWVLKFSCPNRNKIKLKKFACIDSNLTGVHLDRWIKENSYSYSCSEYEPSCSSN